MQVIDLEGLANHRGSALGRRGEQPAQKGFETALVSALAGLDPSRPVVVEAESSKIGNINLPPRFFETMRTAPRVVIEAPLKERATFLARVYADVLEDRRAFNERLDKLVRLQGRDTVEGWKAAIAEGRFVDVAADLIERHYDPRYKKARDRVGGGILAVITADSLGENGLDTLANRVAAAVTK